MQWHMVVNTLSGNSVSSSGTKSHVGPFATFDIFEALRLGFSLVHMCRNASLLRLVMLFFISRV